ncbi:hypothetical protein FISHEDRAFT_73226 [Fistulina hepatica ATCC 64428]|uniref:Ecp2 effector protein domain-containing protein n=1 Tax=Fistulina hepatica ATCC 64428 TaxID=1128425 RepID=A0A0D7ADY4_9AGAR|nr:hypothetical protein FISHEDRAFT_73226 [Fistulina hepatica ATCC 64428]
MQFFTFATALAVFTAVARGANVYRNGDTDLSARWGASGTNESVEASCYNSVRGLLSEPGRQWISPLANACQNWVAKNNTQLWSNKVCVAAAAVSSPSTLRNFDVCVTGAIPSIVIPSQKDLKSLDYNVYASIVGGCAWQKGGCPMTQQNFIDLVYSSVSAYGGKNFPSSPQEVIDHWNIIKKWTATGDKIPYLNFNDWLHYFN